MTNRKVDAENGAFQKRREAEYMFTDITGKPVCLVCGANGAVIKECNQLRYRTKQQELQNQNAEQKRQKVAELKKTFNRSCSAEKESQVTPGEFLKSCRMKVGDDLVSRKYWILNPYMQQGQETRTFFSKRRSNHDWYEAALGQTYWTYNRRRTGGVQWGK